ncbi:MAG: ParB N-terminal domain-containing protein [Planctomycetota bacterium]|nr:ParB N-terminal domain-containing protein [Planctomycetota bacterium]
MLPAVSVSPGEDAAAKPVGPTSISKIGREKKEEHAMTENEKTVTDEPFQNLEELEQERMLDEIETEEEEKPNESSGPTPGGSIRDLPRFKLSDITVPADPLRQTPPTDEGMQRLIASMRKEGQLQPIVITRKKMLVSGQRRVDAAKALGWKDIAYITLPDNVDPYVAEVVANDTVEAIPLLDMSRRVAYEYSKNQSLRGVGDLFHRSASSIKYLLAAYVLTPKMKRDVMAGKISLMAAVKEATSDPAIKKYIAEMLKTGKRARRKAVDPVSRSVRVPKEGLPENVTDVQVYRSYIKIVTKIPVRKGQKEKLDECPEIFSKTQWKKIVSGVPDLWPNLP